ncbi:MAG: hypothetical protein JHC93_07375 [Parachlamydiales bacterium]|nr:hypothetical protein [Parachlamydiales bacterium]
MKVIDYQKALSFHYEKAEQLPQQCLYAAKLLDYQPVFNGRGTIKTCKVIPLNQYNDARIFDIFSRNATKLVGRQSAWHIQDFGGGSEQFRDASGVLINQGIALRLYDNERCSLEALGKAYCIVNDVMRKGWVESNLEDYQDIKSVQDIKSEDSEKFALYVKNSNMIEEDALIRFLTSKFGLVGQIMCYSRRLKEESELLNKSSIYMWINKEALPNIVEKFGFEI